MFLFKYLAHVLKLDFTPRNQVYEGTDYVFIVLRFLFILLSSGKFLEVLCARNQELESFEGIFSEPTSGTSHNQWLRN